MWRKLAKEPLVHFLIAGLVLFALAGQHRRSQDQSRIVITPARIAQLSSAYAAEFGSPPPPAMLPQLIDDYIAAEVLFREGKARGLDRDDEIVRRRVIQKVEFLEQDMASVAEPAEAALRAWYGQNAARYARGARVDFSHIFFAAEAANATPKRRQAAAMLEKLAATTLRAPQLGDSFPDQADFSNFGPDEARRLFGVSDLGAALFKAPVGQWSGPYRSAYGWHLVRVSAAKPGGAADYASVRAQALKDFVREARAAENARRLAALRARYRVVRE